MSEPEVTHVGVRDVVFGARVKIVEPCNLYGCEIGDDCFIGPFTEVDWTNFWSRAVRRRNEAEVVGFAGKSMPSEIA